MLKECDVLNCEGVYETYDNPYTDCPECGFSLGDITAYDTNDPAELKLKPKTKAPPVKSAIGLPLTIVGQYIADTWPSNSGATGSSGMGNVGGNITISGGYCTGGSINIGNAGGTANITLGRGGAGTSSHASNAGQGGTWTSSAGTGGAAYSKPEEHPPEGTYKDTGHRRFWPISKNDAATKSYVDDILTASTKSLEDELLEAYELDVHSAKVCNDPICSVEDSKKIVDAVDKGIEWKWHGADMVREIERLDDYGISKVSPALGQSYYYVMTSDLK